MKLLPITKVTIYFLALIPFCFSCVKRKELPDHLININALDSFYVLVGSSYKNYMFNRITEYKGEKALAMYDGNSSAAFYSFESGEVDYYDVSSITRYKPSGWQITDSCIVMIHFMGHRMSYNFYTDSIIMKEFHPWTKQRGFDYCIQSYNSEKIIETPKYRVMNYGPAHQKKRHFSYHFNRLWSTDLILDKTNDSLFFGPPKPAYILNRSYGEPNHQRTDLNDSILVYSHCVNDSVLFYNLDTRKSYSILMKSPYFEMPDSIPVRPWADYIEVDRGKYNVETSKYHSIHTVKDLNLVVRVILLKQSYNLENGKIRRPHQQDWALDVFNIEGEHLATKKFNGRYFNFNSVQVLNNSIIVNNEKSNTDSSFTYHVFDLSVFK